MNCHIKLFIFIEGENMKKFNNNKIKGKILITVVLFSLSIFVKNCVFDLNDKDKYINNGVENDINNNAGNDNNTGNDNNNNVSHDNNSNIGLFYTKW